MMIKILEQNGVDIENVDGAALNHFSSSMSSGCIKGVLNECTVYSPSPFVAEISSGELLISGFRVKIVDPYSISFAASSDVIPFHIVARIKLFPDRSVDFSIQGRLVESLVQDNLFKNESGVYEIELARLSVSPSGIQDLRNTVPLISGQGVSVQDFLVVEGRVNVLEEQTIHLRSDLVTTKRKLYEQIDSVEKDLYAQIDSAEKKLHNLILANEGNTFTFVTDSSSDSPKFIPKGALRYATMDSIGGMSYVDSNSLIPYPYHGIEEGGRIVIPENAYTYIQDNGDGTLYVTGFFASDINVALISKEQSVKLDAGDYKFSAKGFSTGFPEAMYFYLAFYKNDEVILTRSTQAMFDENGVQLNPYAGADYIDGIYLPEGADSFEIVLHVHDGQGTTFFPALTFSDEKAERFIESAPVTAIKTIGKNICPFKNIAETTQSNGITYEALGDGGIHVYGTATALSNRYFTAYYGEPLPIGYKMTRSGVEKGNGVTFAIARMKKDATEQGGWRVDTYMPSTFETIEGDYQYRIYLQVDVGKTVDLVVYPMLEVGATPTAFALYTEHTYPIPEAVQQLDGYGLGISETLHNYIDFENKTFVRMVAKRAWQEGDVSSETMLTDGTDTIYALDAVETVDLYLTALFDGALEVQEHGYIYTEEGAPSTVTYQVKL